MIGRRSERSGAAFRELRQAWPKLLGAYLALGAWLCGPPTIDREFRTIDFLTLLDLQSPRIRALQLRGRFAG